VPNHTLVAVDRMRKFSYIALLVWLGTDGPGPLSLDRLIARVA
jgi:uncharacterized membrane protein YphA (DoxX/SURF4 family)